MYYKNVQLHAHRCIHPCLATLYPFESLKPVVYGAGGATHDNEKGRDSNPEPEALRQIQKEARRHGGFLQNRYTSKYDH
jgi:hypothetical protein